MGSNRDHDIPPPTVPRTSAFATSESDDSAVAATRRRTVWLTRGWVAFLVATVAFAAILMWRVSALEAARAESEWALEAWRHDVEGLAHDVGYGGFIHEFKNYVLRDGDERYDAVLDEFAQIEERKVRLVALTETEGERQAILAIRNTFEIYRHNAEILKRFRTDKTPAELDRMVKVDDTAAIEAFEVLRAATERRERTAKAALAARVRSIKRLLLGGGFLLVFAVVFARVAVRSQRSAMRLSRESVGRIAELDRHLELLPDAMLHASFGDLGVVRANAAASALFGSHTPLVGARVPDFLAADTRLRDTERIHALLHASAKGSHAPNLQLEMVAHGGMRIAVEMSVATVDSDDGPLAVLTVRDRTEYVEAVRSLESAEARGRAVLQNAHDAILLVDSAGVILQMNRAVESLFGYDAFELTGTSVGDLLPDEDAARWLADQTDAISDFSRIRRGCSRSGDVLDALEVSVSQVRLDGQRCYVLVVRDASARVEHERKLAQLNTRLSEQLEAMQQLGRDNEAIDRFGSFVAVSTTRDEVVAALQIFGDDVFDDDLRGELVLYGEGEQLAERVSAWGEVDLEPPSRRSCWAARRGQLHVVRPDRAGLVCAHRASASTAASTAASDEHDRRSEAGDAERERASACAPVVNQNGVVGVLHLCWAESAATDSSQRRRADVRANRITTLARAMADRVGSALFNVEVEARLERRVHAHSGEWRAA